MARREEPLVVNRRISPLLAIPFGVIVGCFQGVILWAYISMNPTAGLGKAAVMITISPVILLPILLFILLDRSRRRFSVIQDLNHEIRSGLQIITCADVLGPTHDRAMAEAIGNIESAVERATHSESI